MKKIFYSIAFLLVVSACSKENKTSETADSVKVVSTDSAATDTPKSEVLYLEDVLQCTDLQGLENKYGKENIEQSTKITLGEGEFNVTKIYPGSDKEVEIYWKDGQEFKQILDVIVRPILIASDKFDFNCPWVSKEGLHLGMKMSDVVKMNGKTFTITGLGWDLGGNVVSWEGGRLANKNVNIRFNDYSENKGGLSEEEYSVISGDREFDTKHPSLQKLNPVIDQLSVNKRFEITPELGKKMTKEVEEKQIKR